MKRTVIWLGLVAGALLACKDSKPAGSCDRHDVEGWESCFDYPKSQLDSGKSSCFGANPGKWADAPCSHAGALGGCKLGTGITKWFYPGSKIKTAADAKTACLDTWVDP
ncbi:MAG: hypothetical protein IPI67_34410 [Myxococcales bacterium]|nr:hypothetical protein [Myxococcales bacterium]